MWFKQPTGASWNGGFDLSCMCGCKPGLSSLANPEHKSAHHQHQRRREATAKASDERHPVVQDVLATEVIRQRRAEEAVAHEHPVQRQRFKRRVHS
jgi:hypothetical protein